MIGIVFGLLVATALSFLLRSTLWIGFLGVFLLCNLYPYLAIGASAIAVIAYLIMKHRRGRWP